MRAKILPAMTLSVSALVAALSVPAVAEDQIYAELLLGTAQIENVGNEGSVGIRAGYQFHPHFAFEGSYQLYATMTTSFIDDMGQPFDQEFDVDGFTAGIKGIVPLTDSITFVVRLGMAFTEYEQLIADPTIDFSNSMVMPGEGEVTFEDDEEDVYYGVGLEFDMGETMYLGLDYSELELDGDRLERMTLSVGGRF